MSKISFKNFLLNENKYYLGQRVGDILTAVQDLQQNSEGMGARQLVANSQRIVDQVRSILHSNWSKNEEKYLKDLQKVGVALARAIEEKDNLEEILPSISSELEGVVSKMGVPIHSLGTAPEETKGGDEDEKSGLAAPQGKQPPEPKQQQPPPEQQQPQAPPPDPQQQQPSQDQTPPMQNPPGQPQM